MQNFKKFATFKFKDFSRILKYFQTPYLFSSTFKGLEFFYSKFKHFQGFLKHTMNPELNRNKCQEMSVYYKLVQNERWGGTVRPVITPALTLHAATVGLLLWAL